MILYLLKILSSNKVRRKIGPNAIANTELNKCSLILIIKNTIVAEQNSQKYLNISTATVPQSLPPGRR